MLSMSAMSGGQASYYLGLAREDYYLHGGEPPGQWFGHGAEALGLSGQVDADHLYNLFAGRSPWGERSLIQNQHYAKRAEHRPGWDLTFSAPKSVSALWSQADDSRRRAIQAVHEKAVGAALGYLQDEATWTRRGKGGDELERVGLVAATFEHSTSRALDPQLHTHALVMNLSVRADGTSGTLSSLHLFLSKMTAGALYRAELAKGLERELGLAVERERSWFEVSGVSRDVMQAFSKRREAIEEALRTGGLSSAEAAAVAAIQTRSAKESASRAELFEDWRRTGAELGWSTEQTRGLFDGVFPERDPARELEEACRIATERLTRDEAFFTERDFVRYLAEESQGRGLGANEVRAGAAAHLSRSPEIVGLGFYRGEERFTTQETLRLERELLVGATALRVDEKHQLQPETVLGTLSQNGELSEEQMRAVFHVTAQTGALSVVSGMAGTGKTRMLDAAREAWQSEGYRVEGAALAARAAKELSAGSGIEAHTIAKLLHDLERGKRSLDKKTVLVVDEAGMVATPDMRRLVLQCQKAGAKLVLVGDERQLQPIGPGAPFLELGERFTRAELVDVRRQSEPWAREAVKDMADGRAKAALQAFAERGLLTVSPTRDDSMRELVSKWRSGGDRPENTLILAGTRKEVQALNRLAQEERHKASELGEAHTVVGGERIHLNDRVMFTQNKRTLGIQNGARGTVCDVSPGGERLSVRLDSGQKVTLQPHAFPHLQLGYASTTHKAQGATTSRAYVLGGGPIQGRELAYVQASRARFETRIFATATETGADVAQLVREMERSRQKQMAHTVVRRQAENQQETQHHERRNRR